MCRNESWMVVVACQLIYEIFLIDYNGEHRSLFCKKDNASRSCLGVCFGVIDTGTYTIVHLIKQQKEHN